MRPLLAGSMVCLLIASGFALSPAGGFHADGLPVLATLGGSGSGSWAIAIQSGDQAMTPGGNPVAVDIEAFGPHTTSVASVGVLVLDESSPATGHSKGVAVGSFATPEDRAIVASEVSEGDVSEVNWSAIDLIPPGEDSESQRLAGLGYNAHPVAGAMTYVLVWGAGADTIEVTIRGYGVTISEVVSGEATSVGNQELLDGGVQARQSTEPPSGLGHASEDSASIGAGASLVTDASYPYAAEEPIYGVWTYWDGFKGACVNGDCTFLPFPHVAASVVCQQASRVIDDNVGTRVPGGCGGLHDISWSGPDDREGPAGTWLTPSDAPPPGDYRFNVDRWGDVSGPMYLDPATDSGPHLDEDHLWLTMAEIDLSPLGSGG